MRPSSDGSKRSGSRYVLGDLLGRGGMAEVFAGHAVGDHGFQKPVAIKRLLPELANDEVFVERLIEEAKLLVGMQHGNIVSVLDLAREGDDVFLVMEFVDGPSLRQLIKARGARGLSVGVASYIVQSAASGLEFAHARPGGAIIHADISPSNLLLTTSGEVRVADFGIARREGLGHGVVEGKWAYMAPEQARGEALTPRSDVFALGVVLYELLTGQHPFGRAVTAMERDEQMQVIPPRVVKPSIPPGLDAICMRALAHSPRDRYGRMQHLIDALVEERFSNGFRDGAQDLAQTIREVAPKSDQGAPRTMHTERPVTIVTRSLLREVTPARRPSQPLAPAPVAVAASDRFPAVPTMAVATRVLDAAPDPFPAVPTMAVVTAPLAAEPLPELFPSIPSSGEQTVARMVDQLALAQAAQAAAAMLAAQPMNAGLRTDGAPMPPFRMAMARPDVHGDELASVVGGHTMSGQPGVAIEPRGHRWTIVVLGLAALIGVGAAVATQIGPAKLVELAPDRAQVAAAAVVKEPDERAAPARAVQPTILPATPDSAAPSVQPIDDGAQDATRPAGGEVAAGEPKPSDPAAGDAKAGDIASSDAKASEAKSSDAKSGDAKSGDAKSGNGKLAEAKSGDAKSGDAKSGDGAASDARSGEAKSGEAKSGDAKSSDGKRTGDAKDGKADARARTGDAHGERASGRRVAASRDTAKHKPGILSVSSTPWSWVTVDIETKETPAKFYLAPGQHIVKLYNQENGLTKYERVTIESDKMEKLKEDMEQ